MDRLTLGVCERGVKDEGGEGDTQPDDDVRPGPSGYANRYVQ